MRKIGGQRSSWALRQASRYATPDAIRRRIAYEEKQVRDLMSLSSSPEVINAIESHKELIRILTERLTGFEKKTP